MKIQNCQIEVINTDLRYNFNKIIKLYKHAEENKVDICVFPELCISGYLAEDLFHDQDFISDIEHYNNKIIKQTGNCHVVLPTIIKKDNVLYNSVIIAQNGKITGHTSKEKLPNYGIFDEYRYFNPGTANIITINDRKIGIPICEDIWTDSVCHKLAQLGAEIFICVNASPYEQGKIDLRIKQVKKIFDNENIPILYCNTVMAHDGIIFDGKSFCYDNELKIIGKAFSEDIQIIDFTSNKFLLSKEPLKDDTNYYNEIYQATIYATKSYIINNNFKKVVLGLSGGIDSAIVAKIAVDSIGAENVITYMLPSKFTTEESINDAKLLAKNLNIEFYIISIDDIMLKFDDSLNDHIDNNNTSIMHQNLQSRIRGAILMAKSNKLNALLLTTGNKSEYATGYATIYGDMNGGFNPIKDLYKTDIFKIANNLKEIPKNIINKEPSAELSHNQKDSNTLPEYHLLDAILKEHIENNTPRTKLYDLFAKNIVDKTLNLLDKSEFKRAQSAIGAKLSSRNFEKDRRYPITRGY